MTNIESPKDHWSEWKKLALLHVPAGIRGVAGVTYKVLILTGAGILFVRLALWPIFLWILMTLPFVDGPKSVVLVAMILGLTAIVSSVCVCVYRYLDDR